MSPSSYTNPIDLLPSAHELGAIDTGRNRMFFYLLDTIRYAEAAEEGCERPGQEAG